ncbi:winged helix-turn-helix domain-containing tetratricopeptide repeat protein [Halioxenophilus sp. WMMB6]|uniref:winged helix-turn-helix domain-containing tetratricopeptide repeat protein n=1 Tax=Halioxenophilus sp. WMMB6 TaxID=3073815 RepID=UPI00295E9EDB|nr:winged helix-turn-helix domain-containing protein [Halioxenophilus sp. WMMB6]
MTNANEEWLASGFWLENWFVDPQHGYFETNGHRLHIEPKVMEVLVCLAHHHGQVVSRAELLDQVWSNVVVSEEVLTRCISELRSALNDTSRERRFIRTIPKRGYSLLITPYPAGELLPESDTTTSASKPLPQTKSKRRRFAWLPQSGLGRGLLLVLLASLIGVLVWHIRGVKLEALSTTLTQVTHSINAPTNHRTEQEFHLAAPLDVAVLPFVSLSTTDNNDYISVGLAEDIRNKLIRTRGIRVAARTSSEVFMGQSKSIQEIGRALNTRAVLEGTVRMDESRMRVTIQLSDTDSGHPIWADTYERSLGDVFALQEEIATQVAGQLVPALAKADIQATTDMLPASVQAYDNYLLGRFHWNKRTLASIEQAQLYFRQAIELDPNYGPAYAGLADSILLAEDYAGHSYDQAVAQAEPLINKALELNSNDAEANASRGLMAIMQGDDEGAESYYQRAVELNPNYSMARMWLGTALLKRGLINQAYEQYQAALNLDPLHPSIQFNYLMVLNHLGRYADAHELAPHFYSTSHNEALIKADLEALAATGQFSDLLHQATNQVYGDDLLDKATQTVVTALITLHRYEPVQHYINARGKALNTATTLGLRAQMAVAKRDAQALATVVDEAEQWAADNVIKGCDSAGIWYYKGILAWLQRDAVVADAAFAQAQQNFSQNCPFDILKQAQTLAYRAQIAGSRERGQEQLAHLRAGMELINKASAGGRDDTDINIARLSLYVGAGQLNDAQETLRTIHQRGWNSYPLVLNTPLFDSIRESLYTNEAENLEQKSPQEQAYLDAQKLSEAVDLQRYGL